MHLYQILSRPISNKDIESLLFSFCIMAEKVEHAKLLATEKFKALHNNEVIKKEKYQAKASEFNEQYGLVLKERIDEIFDDRIETLRKASNGEFAVDEIDNESTPLMGLKYDVSLDVKELDNLMVTFENLVNKTIAEEEANKGVNTLLDMFIDMGEQMEEFKSRKRKDK